MLVGAKATVGPLLPPFAKAIGFLLTPYLFFGIFGIRMTESKQLHAKLKMGDPEVLQYIIALKAENAKLQKRISKLEAKNLTAKNRIVALQQDLKKMEHRDAPSGIVINLASGEEIPNENP